MKYQRSSILVLVASVMFLGRVEAQVNWHRLSAPSPRCCVGMVFDSAAQSTLLFGGVQGYYSLLGDTWKWGEGGWFEVTPANSPSPREGPGMAYDQSTGTVVLFGGTSGLGGACCDLNDTWIWNGTNWAEVFPPVSPPGRRFDTSGMAYDASSGNVIMFGGITAGNTVFGDTWTWSGTTQTWTQKHPLTSPSARRAPIAYDARTENVVLFGGDDGTNTFGDTWIWNGTNWRQRLPATAPPPRQLAAMAYDRILQRVVLFGGAGVGVGFNDTWKWDGTNWTQVTTTAAPPDRYAFGMVYDPRANGVVLFGGFSSCCGIQPDTWILGSGP
jgi:hypothetical protein